MTAPKWLATVGVLWSLAGGSISFVSAIVAMTTALLGLLLIAPYLIVGILCFTGFGRLERGEVRSPMRYAVAAVVFGLSFLSIASLAIVASWGDPFFLVVACVSSVVLAIPGTLIILGGLVLMQNVRPYDHDRRQYLAWLQMWRDAQSTIRREADEREIGLPEIDCNMLGSSSVKSASWLELAEVGPDGVRYAWRLPSIVDDRTTAEFPPARLQKSLILKANPVEAIFFDGETCEVVRFIHQTGEFAMVAESLAAYARF
jgi:hypothetical protein